MAVDQLLRGLEADRVAGLWRSQERRVQEYNTCLRSLLRIRGFEDLMPIRALPTRHRGPVLDARAEEMKLLEVLHNAQILRDRIRGVMSQNTTTPRPPKALRKRRSGSDVRGLIRELSNIRPGNEHAARYHSLGAC
jgi:hypothetical protein